MSMADYNKTIIEEFRANAGKVGGPFEGAPVVLLTTTGAKSGNQHTTPLMSQPDGDALYVFASMAGAPTNPAWYYNIVAQSGVTIEVGTEKFAATAAVVDRAERDRVYAKQASVYPQFAEYEKKTTRLIPVIKLSRK